MSVELSLAALATADLAIKYGKILIDMYSAFKDAESEINERVLIVEVNWTKTRRQIGFLKSIWKTLDDEHQEQQSQTLDVLVTKLKAAIAQLERVHRKKPGKDEGDVKRWKYAMIKDSIDKAVQDLENWQKIFDPSWFLILKMANPIIDQELGKEDDDKTEVGTISTARDLRKTLKSDAQIQGSIFLPKGGLDAANRESIPYCTAELLQRSTKSSKYIIDSVPCLPEVNARILTEDVRDLARKLAAADPMTFGLLQCRGVVREIDAEHRRPTSFDFIFFIPSEFGNPRSLRHILLSSDPTTSLSDRFKIAQQLARSISYVHMFGFVHKSIRPDTILIFEDNESSLAAAFLLGFEKFRTAAGRTLRSGDSVWEKDLYRHPRRQGLKPEDEYSMQHDIYSLGVCLLEIGLWEPLVMYGGKEEPSPSAILPKFVDEDEDEFKKATLVKDALVDLARQRLPSHMGNKYTDVVVNCLTCLDEGNVDFGNQTEFEDDDGILIGVRYIEKVLLQLNSISI